MCVMLNEKTGLFVLYWSFNSFWILLFIFDCSKFGNFIFTIKMCILYVFFLFRRAGLLQIGGLNRSTLHLISSLFIILY